MKIEQDISIEVIATAENAPEYRQTGTAKFPWPMPDSADERRTLIESMYLQVAQRYAERYQLPNGAKVLVSVAVNGGQFTPLELEVETVDYRGMRDDLP